MPGPGRRALPPRARRRRRGVRRGDRGQQALADRDAGALLIRDCGSAADTAWIHDREDLPRLIRAGRHIARTKRYIRNYAHEVEPDELPAYVAQEAQRGDGWVKLVGDWISRDDGDLAPSFPPEAFAEAIAAAHEHGAQVTAHCFGEAVLPGLIEAGIDCIEHGTGLTPDLIDTMVAQRHRAGADGDADRQVPRVRRGRRGTRFPAYAAHMTDLHARRRDDDHGGVRGRGRRSTPAPTAAGSAARQHRRRGVALAGLGMPAEYALGAASWRAREWLGWNAGLDEGAPADFVVYDRDPLDDLSVLAGPARRAPRPRRRLSL